MPAAPGSASTRFRWRVEMPCRCFSTEGSIRVPPWFLSRGYYFRLPLARSKGLAGGGEKRDRTEDPSRILPPRRDFVGTLGRHGIVGLQFRGGLNDAKVPCRVR